MATRSRNIGPTLPPMHILVADDNDANCLIAQTILERAGHRIFTACNGAEAVRLTKLAQYDLIILDIVMPIMTGLEALKTIRAECSQNQSTPIFALTAYCDFRDRQHYSAEGFDTVLAKPLRRGDLESAFAEYQNQSQSPLKNGSDAHSSNHIPLLDSSMITFLQDCGTPDKLSQIQSRFWASMREKCNAIEASLPGALRGDEHSLSDLRRAIHAIKGACASIGLERVAHISRNLRNAPPAEIAALMRAFIAALGESRPALESAFSGTRQLGSAVQMRGQDKTKTAHDSQNNCSAVGN